MERSKSYENSWADQWDHSNPDPVSEKNSKKKKSSSVADSKYGKKMGEGFEKTKSIASTGFKKMKEGTSLGFNWVKEKYHKTTQKN